MEATLVEERCAPAPDAVAVAPVPLTTKTLASEGLQAQPEGAKALAATAAEPSLAAGDGGAIDSALKAKVQEQARQLQQQSRMLQQALQHGQELEERLRQATACSADAAAVSSDPTAGVAGAGELAATVKALHLPPHQSKRPARAIAGEAAVRRELRELGVSQ